MLSIEEAHLPTEFREARLALLLLSAVSCRNASSDVDPPSREALRERARAVLERECGQCHVPDRPTALKAALNVYDLREVEWARRMTPAQLQKLGTRIVGGAREAFDPYDVRNADAGPPPAPSASDVALVHLYIERELAERQRAIPR